MADTPATERLSIPRRLVKLGILGGVFVVGVLEAVSFFFLACPCSPAYVRPAWAPPVTTPETPPDAAKSTS